MAKNAHREKRQRQARVIKGRILSSQFCLYYIVWLWLFIVSEDSGERDYKFWRKKIVFVHYAKLCLKWFPCKIFMYCTYWGLKCIWLRERVTYNYLIFFIFCFLNLVITHEIFVRGGGGGVESLFWFCIRSNGW